MPISFSVLSTELNAHFKENIRKSKKEKKQRNSLHIGRPPKIDVAALTEETYGYVLQEEGAGANSIQDIESDEGFSYGGSTTQEEGEFELTLGTAVWWKIIMKIHRLDQDSNPGSCSEGQTC